jgi:hypothetical protein
MPLVSQPTSLTEVSTCRCNPIIDIHAHVTLPECQALVEGVMSPAMEPFS